jgi:hypothetical protein
MPSLEGASHFEDRYCIRDWRHGSAELTSTIKGVDLLSREHFFTTFHDTVGDCPVGTDRRGIWAL